jgi:hypothetical protein
MIAPPGCKAVGLLVRKQVDHAPPLPIHEYRAVVMTALKRPVIDARPPGRRKGLPDALSHESQH